MAGTTYTALRDRAEALLLDSTNARFTTATLDEGFQQALVHFSRVVPHEVLANITLAADGREIDISSITEYVNILRVWWDYDSSDPTHPPNWRSFEIWPGDILYINDANEPVTDDVVRVHYTAIHTLNGLNSETVTTLPNLYDTTLVQGAAAYAALIRAISRTEKLNIDGWTPRRLNDWGNTLLKQFTDALKAIARQRAARASGVIQAPALDRWDGRGW